MEAVTITNMQGTKSGEPSTIGMADLTPICYAGRSMPLE